ncbi:prolipoprotein diacylglyceryl transferase [bacterium]|nr:prolipoprotein diacylglyceryl transferase [bacterium]
MLSAYFVQPNIDPVLLHLWGPLQIRWYSLLYVGGFIVARWILIKLSKESRFQFTAQDIEQFIVWLLLGTVIGARIFYCVVYDPQQLLQNPLYLFQTYKGGLAFHGGLMGGITAAILFCRKKGIPFWNFTDAMALATPTGLILGRIGNFINGELYGRVTDVPWAVIFRDGGPVPRHPSQLYELLLEGVLLGSVLWFAKGKLKKDGQLSFLFLFGYSLSRFVVEFFREPDSQLGYLAGGLSMGQILSLIMLAVSAGAAWWFFRSSARKS